LRAAYKVHRSSINGGGKRSILSGKRERERERERERQKDAMGVGKKELRI
jgi:hypothetical protein